MTTSKGMWIALIAAGLALVALYYIGRARRGALANTTRTSEPSEVYHGLRSQILAFSAPEIAAGAKADAPLAYGVVMDLSLASGTATIVSLYTGDTSMYTSTGGGIIGGIGHESCRTASKQFIAVAQEHLGLMRKTETYPVPPTGIFRFYVLTTDGVYTAEEKEAVITRLKGPLAPLFKAGDDVITQLRLTAPKQ